MAKLVECPSCHGLKRADSERCPHCRTPAGGLLKRSVAAAGLGAMAACCPSPAPCVPQPLGECVPIEAPADSGVPTDAYGIVALRDSGPPFIGADAYGAPPFLEDAGTADGGAGDDDD